MRCYFWLIVLLSLGGCGTITGIPGHGGGKRFAIEQELVASTIRSAVKDLNVSRLAGKTVATFIVGMGDEGVGNLTGGRYSIDALIRGEYINTPQAQYPIVTTKTITDTTTATTERAINNAVEEKGFGIEGSVGAQYRGLGEYKVERPYKTGSVDYFLDGAFLRAVLEQYLMLMGATVVSPDDNTADINVYLLVDVFGTIRTRTDWHLVNEESLVAKTAIELSAICRHTGKVMILPQTSAYEAEYSEEYYLWAGPFKTTKKLRSSDSLLVDFRDLTPQDTAASCIKAAPPLLSPPAYSDENGQ